MPVDLAQRREFYKQIEEYRKRPLIVYATSTRAGVNAMMAADVVREFVDQVNAVPDGAAVDVLIHSTGGDPLTAWKLMSLLRERFTDVSVLVPYMAFSAATIFSLGADQIFMHPHASLGPIDPQIQMRQADGTVRVFAYEDVGAFLRFLESDVQISEQAHISSVVERLFQVADPLNIGAAKRASELSADIGERLLHMHMKGEDDNGRARQIAENLNKAFFAHGDAVSRGRAKELQLKIADSDPALEKLMWQAYSGLESLMELRRPFSPLQVFLADPSAAATLQPIAPVPLPANAPLGVAQQVWGAVVNQLVQNAANGAVQVSYELIAAVCESTRCASEARAKGTISAWYQAPGEVKVNIVESESGWRKVD